MSQLRAKLFRFQKLDTIAYYLDGIINVPLYKSGHLPQSIRNTIAVVIFYVVILLKIVA